MDNIKNILNNNQITINKKIRPLKKLFSNFNNLKKNSKCYTNNQIISKAKCLIDKSNNFVHYPQITLSSNWLILSSQLSELANIVVKQMCSLYFAITDNTIHNLHLLSIMQKSNK